MQNELFVLTDILRKSGYYEDLVEDAIPLVSHLFADLTAAKTELSSLRTEVRELTESASYQTNILTPLQQDNRRLLAENNDLHLRLAELEDASADANASAGAGAVPLRIPRPAPFPHREPRPYASELAALEEELAKLREYATGLTARNNELVLGSEALKTELACARAARRHAGSSPRDSPSGRSPPRSASKAARHDARHDARQIKALNSRITTLEYELANKAQDNDSLLRELADVRASLLSTVEPSTPLARTSRRADTGAGAGVGTETEPDQDPDRGRGQDQDHSSMMSLSSDDHGDIICRVPEPYPSGKDAGSKKPSEAPDYGEGAPASAPRSGGSGGKLSLDLGLLGPDDPGTSMDSNINCTASTPKPESAASRPSPGDADGRRALQRHQPAAADCQLDPQIETKPTPPGYHRSTSPNIVHPCALTAVRQGQLELQRDAIVQTSLLQPDDAALDASGLAPPGKGPVTMRSRMSSLINSFEPPGTVPIADAGADVGRAPAAAPAAALTPAPAPAAVPASAAAPCPACARHRRAAADLQEQLDSLQLAYTRLLAELRRPAAMTGEAIGADPRVSTRDHPLEGYRVDAATVGPSYAGKGFPDASDALRSELYEKTAVICSLQGDLDGARATVAALRRDLVKARTSEALLRSTNVELQATNTAIATLSSKLEAKVAEKAGELDALRGNVREADCYIRELADKVREGSLARRELVKKIKRLRAQREEHAARAKVDQGVVRRLDAANRKLAALLTRLSVDNRRLLIRLNESEYGEDALQAQEAIDDANDCILMVRKCLGAAGPPGAADAAAAGDDAGACCSDDAA